MNRLLKLFQLCLISNRMSIFHLKVIRSSWRGFFGPWYRCATKFNFSFPESCLNSFTSSKRRTGNAEHHEHILNMANYIHWTSCFFFFLNMQSGFDPLIILNADFLTETTLRHSNYNSVKTWLNSKDHGNKSSPMVYPNS